MEVLLPLSTDIHVVYGLDYTGRFRVHTWQRRCSWRHIRHISSPRLLPARAGGIWYTVVTVVNRNIYDNRVLKRVDA